MQIMRIFLWLIITMFAVSCFPLKENRDHQPKKELKIEPNEAGEYDIVVMDPGYELFLNSRAYPKGYFTESYLASRNRVLVNIWNQRHAAPQAYNPNIYEVYIDYESTIEYGLTFQWKLFNFFMFVEDQTGERIDGLSPMIR